MTFMVPSVVEAPTFISHAASASPLGKVWLTVPSRGVLSPTGSSLRDHVPVVGTGSGPSSNQILCQCEVNTLPPRDAYSYMPSRTAIGFSCAKELLSQDRMTMSYADRESALAQSSLDEVSAMLPWLASMARTG